MRIPRTPPDVDEISLKYDLQTELGNYLRRKDVVDFINHANEKYLYWEEVRFRPAPEDTNYDLLWATIKIVRELQQKEILISDVDGFDFTYWTTDLISQKLHEFDMSLGGSIVGKSFITSHDKDMYLISSLMEEAIASSQLEGAATTRKIAKDMLRKGRKPRTHSERMIANNYRSINMILDLKDEKLTPQLLLDIQESMTRHTLENPEHEGRFRDSNDVYVMDRSTNQLLYEPPDHEMIPKLIDDLCRFANDPGNDQFMHPVIKASFLHFLIGYIHPFFDGNGRTARSIFYWYLIQRGYRMIEFMPISRAIIKAPSKYARAYLYTEKDENDFTYFLMYQINAMDQSMKDLKTYLKRQTEKRSGSQFDRILRLKSINLRQANILRKFVEKPDITITISEVSNIYNVVYQTARTDLLGLVDLGLLDSKVGSRKKFIFFRSEGFEEILQKKTSDNQ